MQALIDWYNQAIANQEKNSLILIANFIFEFLAIHPFQDGNGRASRLLTNLMLLNNEYLFAKLVPRERLIELNKVNYYRALNKTQQTWKTEQEDITRWLLFFLNTVKKQSQQALKLIENDHIEHLLSEKKLLLWQRAEAQPNSFNRKDAIEALAFPARTVESIIKKLVTLKRLKRIR